MGVVRCLRVHWRDRGYTDNCLLVAEQRQSRQEDSTAVPGPGETSLAQHCGPERLAFAGGRLETLPRREREKRIAGGLPSQQ